MNDDYIRYAQSRKHENLSAIGHYLEIENYALIDKYITQKQHFGMGSWANGDKLWQIKNLDKRKYELCQEHNLTLLYLAKKQDRSYIKDDIIYKDKIYFDIDELIRDVINK